MYSPNTLSNIQNTYHDAVIFITGVTGFIGKLLLEKILRSLNPKLIYILIRPKNDNTIEERFNAIFESPIFEEVKLKYPNYLEKIQIISGDLLIPELGLNSSDKKKLIKNVNFVFHSAATVRFNETLRKATILNVRATNDLLNLAKLMRELKLFVYVSTAFSHCPQASIDEKVYKTTIEGNDLIKIIELFNEQIVNKIEIDLVGKWPNTYTFTKAITENLVEVKGKEIPTAIMRPSIVVGAVKEPIKGFTDSLFGMTGMGIANSIGFSHTMHANPNYRIDVIPVDYVVNNLLAIGWYVTNHKFTQQTPVFNCVSGVENPITLGRWCDICFELTYVYPTMKLFWYPFVYSTPNLYFFLLLNFIFHTFPAHIVDLITICIGKTPRLVKAYERLSKMTKSVSYFVLNEWCYNTENNRNMYKSLSPSDRVLFNFNISDVNWKSYIKDYYLACREHVVKDPIKTLEKGKERLRIMRIFHFTIVTFVLILFILLLYWVCFKLFF